MKRALASVTGAVFGITLVATCGLKNQFTYDGGTDDMLPDVVADMLGVGDANAQAGNIYAAPCDKVRTITQTSSSLTSVQTTWYAEIAIAGFKNNEPHHITAVGCDHEFHGSITGRFTRPCPAGYTCETTGYPADEIAFPCESKTFSTGMGRILVFCGIRQTNTFPNSPTSNSDSGYRSQNVYVRVD